MTVVGVDAGSASLREADHLVHDLVTRLGLPPDVIGCTHLIRSGARHVALSFRSADDITQRLVALAGTERLGVAIDEARFGPHELAQGAAEALVHHRTGQAGRAVVYPGVAELTGTVTVGAVLASAIGRIAVLAGPEELADDDVVQTRDHVRPEWRDGVLTLTVTPLAPGLYAPFEVPNPTPCCVDHG